MCLWHRCSPSRGQVLCSALGNMGELIPGSQILQSRGPDIPVESQKHIRASRSGQGFHREPPVLRKELTEGINRNRRISRDFQASNGRVEKAGLGTQRERSLHSLRLEDTGALVRPVKGWVEALQSEKKEGAPARSCSRTQGAGGPGRSLQLICRERLG